VGADIEREPARLHEPRVELVHRSITWRVAVVDIERALQGGERRISAQRGETFG